MQQTTTTSNPDPDAVYNQLKTLQHNITALHKIRAPPWVMEPNMRGTTRILLSCLLTLFACVYTALHLNVPKRGAGFWKLLGDKCVWVLVALVAPEILLYYACSQFIEARKLVKYLRAKEMEEKDKILAEELAAQEGYSTSSQGECTFDLEYGFFVVMGGLQLECPGPDGENILRTLSPDGVRVLGDIKLEPLRVPKSLIMDRSKADTIQKALVLIQVSWMAIQCIARKIEGLPMTLLELHVMVHVVCAFVINPLDLRSPELIDNAAYGNKITIHEDPQTSETRTPISHHSNNPPTVLKPNTHFYARPGDFPEVRSRGYLGINLVINMFLSQRRLRRLWLITPLPILYGGIHLSAWTFQVEFPTRIEGILWNVSCIGAASGIPVHLLSGYFGDRLRAAATRVSVKE
ncbi:hypothetical protein N0V88_007067 [Collariella sp. IMI 366227]|nr:hypothetical protein N0V88_007067 [Collariella sp. IMI 366227]